LSWVLLLSFWGQTQENNPEERYLSSWVMRGVPNIDNTRKDAKTITKTRKWYYPFRLKGRPLNTSKRWVLRVLCGTHNHDVVETLVGYTYDGWLTRDEKTMLIDMIEYGEA